MTIMPRGNTHILYRFFDVDDVLLYIGITNNLVGRYEGHAHDKTWYRTVVRSTMEHHPSRQTLLQAEAAAIREEKPRWNRTHNSVPQPATMAVRQGGTYVSKLSSDASAFRKPDAIADEDDIDEAERERRLDELEEMLRRKTVTRHNIACTECGYPFICEEHDGLYRCHGCLNMWTPEEWSPLSMVRSA